ncbi:MAG: hypothetical protein KJI69_02720 [Patescibacteria group bacterium]|nr:hypothetical protein [Patescibacteria group bacterium]
MRNISQKILLGGGIILILGLFLIPFQADAGLVQCGLSEDIVGTNIIEDQPCGFCNIFQLGHNVITFFLFPSGDLNGGFAVVPSLAGLLLAVGGIYLLVGAGNPTLHEKGKKTLTSVVIGLLIVYTAWIFVNTFLAFLGVASWTGLGSWWQIQCGI